MGMERIAERHKAGVKSCFALFAAPRIQTENAEKIIASALAARTASVLALTDWTIHLGDEGL
jgi:hypothetical protein